MDAGSGAFYLNQGLFDGKSSDTLVLAGRYAHEVPPGVTPRVKVGEGLTGQAALEGTMRFVTASSPLRITGSLVEVPVAEAAIVPICYESETLGVLEIAFPHRVDTGQKSLLEQMRLSLGLLFQTLREKLQTERLLEESRKQAEQLKRQSEELKSQQDQLSSQQEEIVQVNQELESKNYLLQQRAHDLARSSEYKSNFLANMSHELRTPLNCILILSKLLAENRENRLHERDLTCAKNIHAAAGDLRNLIEDILDFSKIEAGKLKVDIEEIALEEVWSSLERTFSAIAREKGVEFRITLAPGLPEKLRTDQMRFEQILKNLCSNALKFTREGSVTLDARFAPADGTLVVSVEDTGIGIPAEQLEAIFESFRQVDGSGRREHGGTGLGLTISRQLARFLGGEIEVTSVPGTGSCFTVTITDGGPPAEELLVPESTFESGELMKITPAEIAAAAPPIPDLREKKILIVDDDVRNIYSLQALLERENASILTARNGAEALEVLDARPDLDLVLMDMMMPEVDGYEAMRRIRLQDRYRDLPVIALTAKAMPWDREQCMNAGASEYLPKPIDADKLVSVIKAWLSRSPSPGPGPG